MKNNKIYELDNRRYRFDSKSFQGLMNQLKYNLKVSKQKKTKDMIMNEIAEKLSVSYEAVKNWAYGYNGPTDLELVKKIGAYFKVDYRTLLLLEDEKVTERNTSDMREAMIYTANDNTQAKVTKDSVREIYKATVDYYSKCRMWYFDLKGEENKSIIALAHDDLGKAFMRIDILTDYAMLDLTRDQFKMFKDFIWVDLIDYIDLIAYTGEETSEEELEEYKEDIEYYLADAEERIEKFLRYGYLDEVRRTFGEFMLK